MAGDWTAIEHGTVSKSEIGLLMAITGRSRHEVFGLMVHFWGWAETQTIDGKIAMPISVLPSFVGGDAAFWEAVQSVGWLECLPDGSLQIPRADHWLTHGAKARLKESRRKKGSGKPRKESGRKPDENVPTEENRTEESPKGFLSESDSESDQGRNGFSGNRSASRSDSVFSKVTDDTLKQIAELRKWFLWQATMPNRVFDSGNPDNWRFCVAAALQSREATKSQLGLFASLVGGKSGRSRIKDKHWNRAAEVVRDFPLGAVA